ncbi:MAG: KH domain-containing protein [Chthoniobacterales bacterium]
MDNARPTAKVESVRQFLEFVLRQLVEAPDEVIISEIPNGRLTTFRLRMRQSDVGRVIGRNGQTIRALRALLSSAAARHGQKATLDIIE